MYKKLWMCLQLQVLLIQVPTKFFKSFDFRVLYKRSCMLEIELLISCAQEAVITKVNQAITMSYELYLRTRETWMDFNKILFMLDYNTNYSTKIFDIQDIKKSNNKKIPSYSIIKSSRPLMNRCAEVETVQKNCTEVQVLLHCFNCTQLQLKVLYCCYKILK